MDKEDLGALATARLAGAQPKLLLCRPIQSMDKGDVDTLATAGQAGAQPEQLLCRPIQTAGRVDQDLGALFTAGLAGAWKCMGTDSHAGIM